MGSGGGPAQRARPGLEWPRVGGHRDLHTPQPSSQAPRARTHACPPGQWGVLDAPRAPGPGQALAALVLAVFGGAGRRQQAGVRSRVVRLKYSTPRDERCGPLARPAGQSEREAKRKALRAPRANRHRLRPYQPEGARSRLISEAKQGRAWLGSWMGDHLGILGARGFLPGSNLNLRGLSSSFRWGLLQDVCLAMAVDILSVSQTNNPIIIQTHFLIVAWQSGSYDATS